MSQKLKAIFLPGGEARTQAYGPAEMAELAQFVHFLPLAPGRVGDADGLAQVEAVFSGWGVPVLDEALLARLPACRVVFHAAGTVRTFVTPALWQRGIRLTSAAEANAIPVAEYTMAAITFSLKHAWARLLELRERRDYRRSDATMPGAYGSTVGLLSLSRIGCQVAHRLRGMDVRVIAYDPVCDPAVAQALNVELCPLADVFVRADVVSCHMPLLPETRGLIGAAEFALLKPGATFINTARGDLVHEADLVATLLRRPDLFAVLDVQQQEPLPLDSPLRSVPNLVLTPHLAGSLGSECRRMGRFMIDEVRRYRAGQPLFGEVRAADLATTA